jgi:hypothetical protein
MRKLPLAIWAMVVGAFAMGADEFIVAGVVQGDSPGARCVARRRGPSGERLGPGRGGRRTRCSWPPGPASAAGRCCSPPPQCSWPEPDLRPQSRLRRHHGRPSRLGRRPRGVPRHRRGLRGRPRRPGAQGPRRRPGVLRADRIDGARRSPGRGRRASPRLAVHLLDAGHLRRRRPARPARLSAAHRCSGRPPAPRHRARRTRRTGRVPATNTAPDTARRTRNSRGWTRTHSRTWAAVVTDPPCGSRSPRSPGRPSGRR